MEQFTIYLAGAIEKTKDGGLWIRKNVRDTLKMVEGVKVIDPCDFAINQQYKTLREVVQTNRCWKSIIRSVIDGDIDTVENVNLIVAIINKSAGGGTITECVTAYRNDMPVIGYYQSEDVYNDRADCIHPWLLAAVDKECVNDLERLRRLVVGYMVD
jgi:hypothetical protein